MIKIWKIFALIFILTFQSSCEEKDKITDVELISFCEKLETSIINRDPTLFNNSLFEAGLQKRVFEGYHAGGGLSYALNHTLNNYYKLGDRILSTVMHGDFIFEVTRVYRDDDENPWAVFRLFNGVSFNYIEFQFEKILNQIRITEGYYYNTGQELSETIRDLVFMEVGFDGKGKNDPNIKKYYHQGIEFMVKAQKEMLLQNYQNALDSFEMMDQRLMQHPFFFVQKINILGHLNEDELFKNIEVFDNAFPNEERFNILNAVQLQMYKGEVEATRKAIHFLSKHVGNDAVLDYYEANALLNNGDYDKAIFYCDKFIEQRPGLIFGYSAKTIAFIQKKDYESATNNLSKIIRNFNTSVADLEDAFQDFPEFFSSEEYELWKKGLSKI